MPKPKRRRQWGAGSVTRRPSGGWQVRWVEAGKRRSQTYSSREDAERVLAAIKGEIARGRTGLPADPRTLPSLAEVVDGPTGLLERRKLTHRTAAEDRYRWRKHLAPFFAHLRPSDVDAGRIRAYIEAKLAEGVNPATIRIHVALLSSIFIDLQERKVWTENPARGLPPSIRRLMRPTHDPRTTPFIEKLSDVRRIFLALPKPLHVAYAIGALAGLRTGEVFALRWAHVDLEARRIHVRESVKGPLKDTDSRIVPILDPLLPILKAWHLETGGSGRVVPPLRCDGEKIDKHTPGAYLRAATGPLGLLRDGLGWYEATRHTFASQWVMAGGSIEKLKEILGHYSVTMTERYAHLRPELFTPDDLGTLELDLAAGGKVVALENGSKTGAAPEKRRATSRKNKRKTGAAL